MSLMSSLWFGSESLSGRDDLAADLPGSAVVIPRSQKRDVRSRPSSTKIPVLVGMNVNLFMHKIRL